MKTSHQTLLILVLTLLVVGGFGYAFLAPVPTPGAASQTPLPGNDMRKDIDTKIVQTVEFQVPPTQAGHTANNLHAQTVSADYAHLLNEAALIESDAQRISKLNTLLEAWADDDANAALAWLLQQGEQESLEVNYSYVFQSAVEQDFAGVSDRIADISNRPYAQSMFHSYALKLADTMPAKALDWSYALIDDDSIDGTQRDIFLQWAARDPQAALTHLSSYDNVASNVRTETASFAIANLISTTSEAIPLEVIYQFPDELRPELAAGIIVSLAETDMHQAINTLDSLPQDATRDHAVQRLVESAESGAEYVSDLFALAQSVDDDTKRINLVSRTFQNWYLSDSKGASNALLGSTLLGEEDKSRLINSVDNKELAAEAVTTDEQ